jgi:hypothetical protein
LPDFPFWGKLSVNIGEKRNAYSARKQKQKEIEMKKIAYALCACLLAAGAAQAATITWSDAVTMSTSNDVSTTGTTLYAYSLNGSGGTKTLTGVDFEVAAEGAAGVFGNLTSSVDLNQNATTFSSGTTPWASLTADYQAVVKGGVYLGTDDTTWTLDGLTSGKEYQVQIWITDPRTAIDRTAYFYGEGNNTSTTAKILDFNVGNAAGGLGQYIIGTFTASGTSQSFLVEGGTGAGGVAGDGGIQLNALQVRAIPEPATIGMLGLGALITLLIRRQIRS